MKKIIIVPVFFLLCTSFNFSYGQLWKQYADSASIYIKNKMADNSFACYIKAKKVKSGGAAFSDSLTPRLKEIALLFYKTGNHDKAVVVCDEIKAITAEVHTEMNIDYAWACNMQGAIAQTEGNLGLARSLYFKSKDIREKLLDVNNPAYAQTCNNLGALYRDYGQYEEAESMLQKAMAIRKELNRKEMEKNSVYSSYAITCTSLANLYRDMGQYDTAEQLYIEARRIRSVKREDSMEYVASCNILADLYSYSYMGKPEQAEALYLEAKDSLEKWDKESSRFGESCNNLASLYRDMGLYKKAEGLALKANKVFREAADDANITINLNSLGDLYYAMGNYKKSEQYFLQARGRWMKTLGKDHPYLTANTEALAKLYRDINQTEKAEKSYGDVIQSRYIQLDKIFAFTNENEKQLYLENINGSNDEFYSFYYNKIARTAVGQLYALSLMYRNLILSSSRQLRQLIFNSNDTSLRKTYADWISVKKQLSWLYTQGSEADKGIGRSLENRADSLEKILSRRSSAFASVQKRIRWSDIQKKLKPGEAAIEFAEFNFEIGERSTDSTYYVALLLRKDKPEPELIPLFEKKQLDSLFIRSGDRTKNDKVTAFYTRGIDNKANKNMLSTHSAYRMIWMPVESKLKGIKKIYFAPAGLLHRVSFAALAIDSIHVLSDKYQLVQLSSTASVADLKDEYISPEDKIDLYGDIDYGTATASSMASGNFVPPLPGTALEVNNIRNLATRKTYLFTGATATEESVKSLDGSASPAILHIATHGFFESKDQTINPDSAATEKKEANKGATDPLLRSGLLMAGVNNRDLPGKTAGSDDGVLTSYEVSNLYLPNTRLVVLSACETGLGDIEGNEGVYGLQRAFKMAGAENLVMSLWKVPDVETAEFMGCFYENLFAKESIRDAFTHAQTVMRNKYRGQPIKWGAWVLVQ